MAKIEPSLPDGLEYTIPFNTTKFVSAAISNVYRTLVEAGLLVLVVILVFLQNWRALLVPATTVPVTIVGAFSFLYVFGFSINLLTLFALILAIGIVVDDAIVIVENASHHIETGEAPREATIKAMNEVTGPVIAITFVLMAVFIPTAFLGGITGQMYRQFALTIAATAVISAVDKLVPDKAVAARILSVDATMTPIAKRDGALIAFGCEQHNCGSHNWAISLKPDGTRPRICYKPDGESPRWYGDQPVGAAKDSCPSGDTGGPA